MGKRLAKKVAIVTGAGKGIGRGVARVFADEGAKVVVVNRSESNGKKTADDIIQAGSEAIFIQADISRKDDVEKMAHEIVQQLGRIDILCANAGIYVTTKIEDMTEESWDKIVDVNLRGTFLTIKACLPQMIAQKYGRIIVTSSITGPRTAIPGHAHYAASKAGVNGLIRGAALDLAKYNITVNGIEPGNILTEGLKELGDKHVEGMKEAIPLGRLGTPEDIGYAMLFLVSDEAEWITGQTLIVDGGQLLPESKFVIS